MVAASAAAMMVMAVTMVCPIMTVHRSIMAVHRPIMAVHRPIMTVHPSVMADLIGHLHPRSLVNQPLGSMLVAVEYHIFNALQQFRLDLVVDLKHRRVNDRHIQTGLDRMI